MRARTDLWEPGANNRPGPPGLDGINLLPFLDGKNFDAPHEFLFWRFGNQMAVRKGDWKITKAAGPAGQGGGRRRPASHAQLYNLAQDIGEDTDVAAEHADTVKELTGAWEKWNSELIEPRWQGRNARGERAKKPNK